MEEVHDGEKKGYQVTAFTILDSKYCIFIYSLSRGKIFKKSLWIFLQSSEENKRSCYENAQRYDFGLNGRC